MFNFFMKNPKCRTLKFATFRDLWRHLIQHFVEQHWRLFFHFFNKICHFWRFVEIFWRPNSCRGLCNIVKIISNIWEHIGDQTKNPYMHTKKTVDFENKNPPKNMQFAQFKFKWTKLNQIPGIKIKENSGKNNII